MSLAGLLIFAACSTVVAPRLFPTRPHPPSPDDNPMAVTSTIETGRYHWVVNVVNGNSYFNLIPTNSLRLDKFHAAVKVQFVQGNDDGQSAYGLTFRHVDNDYGFFGILKSGRLSGVGSPSHRHLPVDRWTQPGDRYSPRTHAIGWRSWELAQTTSF